MQAERGRAAAVDPRAPGHGQRRRRRRHPGVGSGRPRLRHQALQEPDPFGPAAPRRPRQAGPRPAGARQRATQGGNRRAKTHGTGTAPAQKLEAVGQLAAGIAHEINTPAQYVGDNARFLDNAFADIGTLLDVLQRLLAAAKQGPVPERLAAEADAAVCKAPTSLTSRKRSPPRSGSRWKGSSGWRASSGP